jgi:hypothetical protein
VGRPALAGPGPALASGLALAGLRSGFFWLALFREILVAKFFNLGRKFDEKSSIPREIRGIGARKFVECRSTPKTSNLWIKTTNNSTNQEIKIRGNFGAIFCIFEIYGGNHKQE